MKYGLLLIGLLLGASGCASMQEAYHLDREIGQASRASWEQQVAYPDAQTKQVPEGVAGITAEEI